MEESRNTAAFILRRRAYREHDVLVDLYSLDKGKLSLLARGAKKSGSKLAGHIEPLTLADIMIVRGRGFDYLASAVTACSYPGIRQDLNKLYYAGQALKSLRDLLQDGLPDSRVFYLLGNALETLDQTKSRQGDLTKERGQLWLAVFILKFLSLLGYEPALNFCLSCRLAPDQSTNYLDLLNRGLVCAACYDNYLANNKVNKEYILTISYNCAKILRWALKVDMEEAMKLQLDEALSREYLKIVRKLLEFRH